MIRHIFRRLCLKVAAASIYFCQPLFLCPVHGKGASAKEIIRPLIQAVVITAVKEYDFSVQAAVFCRNFSGGRSLAVFEVPFIFVEVISPFSGIPFICRYKIICTVHRVKSNPIRHTDSFQRLICFRIICLVFFVNINRRRTVVFIARRIYSCDLKAVQINYCNGICLLQRYICCMISCCNVFRLQVCRRSCILFQHNSRVHESLSCFCAVICLKSHICCGSLCKSDHRYCSCRICRAFPVTFPRFSFICCQYSAVIRGKCYHVRLDTCLICLFKCQRPVRIADEHRHTAVICISFRLNCSCKFRAVCRDRH